MEHVVLVLFSNPRISIAKNLCLIIVKDKWPYVGKILDSTRLIPRAHYANATRTPPIQTKNTSRSNRPQTKTKKRGNIFYTFSLFFHLHFYSFPCEKLKIIFPSTHPPTHTTNLPIFFEAIYYREMASGHSSYQHSREFIAMCVVFSFLLAFTSFSPLAVIYSEPADDNIRRNGKENSTPFHRLIFLRVGSSFVRTNTMNGRFGI